VVAKLISLTHSARNSATQKKSGEALGNWQHADLREDIDGLRCAGLVCRLRLVSYQGEQHGNRRM
jgi:hypothetical protein